MNKPIKYVIFLVTIITLVNFVILLIFSLIWRNFTDFSPQQVLIYLLTSLVAALLVSFFVTSTAPILKDFLATYRRLLRLESLSHPLLLKLSLEAPGTYHHSLALASLAHRAAKSIGADPLLTRVGAYYHDIGKLKNPDYYIENQRNGQNIHQEIDDPQKSAKTIIEHVRYGIELAKEHQLPGEVVAFISEHHGTLVTHFYQEAKEKGLKIKKNDFRYPGPKPLSRETAILMVADALEAKIRLIKKVDAISIKKVVEEVIQERIDDKQLELSGLTNKEIEKLRNSFIETLGVSYHQRIEYSTNGKPQIDLKLTK